MDEHEKLITELREISRQISKLQIKFNKKEKQIFNLIKKKKLDKGL